MVWGDPLVDHAQQGATVRLELDRASAASVCRRLVYLTRIADAAPRGAAFVLREVAALPGFVGRREVVALLGVAGLDEIACLRAAADQHQSVFSPAAAEVFP